MCDIKSKILLAKKTIVLIDDFVDEMTMEILEQKKDEVEVFVYSRNRLMLPVRNVRRRKTFQAGFHFLEANCFRNRYLLIDGKFLFLLSRSIRFNARRSFWFIQLFDIEDIMKLRRKIRECEVLAGARYRHF